MTHSQAAESVHIRIDRPEYEATFRKVFCAWHAVRCMRGRWLHKSRFRSQPNTLVFYQRAARASKRHDTRTWNTQTQVLLLCVYVCVCLIPSAFTGAFMPHTIKTSQSLMQYWVRLFDSKAGGTERFVANSIGARNVFFFPAGLLVKTSWIRLSNVEGKPRKEQVNGKTDWFHSIGWQHIMQQVWSISHHIWYHLKVSLKGPLRAHYLSNRCFIHHNLIGI